MSCTNLPQAITTPNPFWTLPWMLKSPGASVLQHSLDMCQCKYCKLAQTNPQNHDTYILWRSLNILNCNCMNWTNIACYSTSVHDLSTVANHDFGSELPWASSEIRQRMALPMTPSQTASRPQTATQSTSTITSSDTIPGAFAYHLARTMNEMQDKILNN